MVIPAHNAERFIERAVESVRNQSFSDWELIIVENGSTDATYTVCEQFLDDERIVLAQSAKGVSNARNTGLALSSGSWICFLDADDYLINNALMAFATAIDANVDLIVGEYDHNKSANRKPELVSNDDFMELSLCNPTQYCNVTACLFRKSLINKSDLRFDSHLTHAEDSVFLVGFISANARIKMLNQPVYHVYYNPDSAVRAGNDSRIEAYGRSIEAIKGTLEKLDHNFKQAFDAFVLNQILILMVHDIYGEIKDVKSYKDAGNRFDLLVNNKIYLQALNDEALQKLPMKKRICLFFIKKKCHFITYMIVRYRQLGNAHKSKSDCNYAA